MACSSKEAEGPLIINLLDPSRSRPQPRKPAAPRSRDSDSPPDPSEISPIREKLSPARPEKESVIPSERPGNTKPRRETPKPLLLQLLPSTSRNSASSADVHTRSAASVTPPVALDINGTYQTETSLLSAPLATADPALEVACSRGREIFSASGGISTAALNETRSQSPIFNFSSISAAVAFYRRVPSLSGSLREIAPQTPLSGTLTVAKPFLAGTAVHVEITYACGEPADPRKVDAAMRAACLALVDADRPDGLLGLQMPTDSAAVRRGAAVEPRGISVLAWGTVANGPSQEALGCSTAMLRSVLDEYGSRGGRVKQKQSPSAADVAAALLEGGESATSHLTAEHDAATDELTLSLFFPSLRIDSPGGAAEEAAQTEALESIGGRGERGEANRWALAETVAALALAVEISSLAALAIETCAARRREQSSTLKSKL
ncbi:hypothetical protein QTJ16_005718 [Diplocarpon rosae]|uniref:Uncharacterized protein n=1 Tax=Diplocarpon rosae TaxID=946125 RepID=A0AAD9SYB0_9HELO|nr:hypothetical protein QTJ16_005718 [Diplocarpon rosae]